MSPDGRIEARLQMNEGQALLTVLRDGKVILHPSPLGLEVREWKAGRKWVAETVGDESETQAVKEHDQTWRPVFGKRSEVRDTYHFTVLKLRDAAKPNAASELRIHVRSYNGGVALRYELPGEGKRQLNSEITLLRFASDPTCWSYAGENPNIGPESLSKATGIRRTPLLAKTGDGQFVALHQAALFDAPAMSLIADLGKQELRVRVPRYRVELPYQTPWRVILLGDAPGNFVDSDLILNLNPPCAIEDPSWIKPGVSFWDWRAWGHEADDFTYGLNLESWKRFVDFAEETGVPYLLLDADWYGPEFEAESDPTKTGKVSAVRELLEYSKERGVGILLYLNDVAGQKYDLDAVLKNYSEWGAVGIKYGFMKREGLDKVNNTREIIALCAKHRLMVDFHDGPIPPGGDMRTYPNCVTREYCHAQADSKRSFTPGTFVTHSFVNTIAGPIDMNNGMFDLENSKAQRPRVFEEIHSTIVGEAARTLIVFSGLTVVPDSADSYRKHKELFGFIAAQKMPWKESRTLSGEIGEHITMMRQTGETYLVASATNEQARELNISLDFLGEGTYQATLYEDAEDAHYIENRVAYNIRSQKVTSADTLRVKLASGGGHAIKLTPVKR